jgi:hypothetical protein
MAFLAGNSLLITSGDGFDYREDAQRLDSLWGKRCVLTMMAVCLKTIHL